jgi:hypothetical protein
MRLAPDSVHALVRALARGLVLDLLDRVALGELIGIAPICSAFCNRSGMRSTTKIFEAPRSRAE